MKTKATPTAYYNRDPKQLTVDKPEGDWMAFHAFLKSLGFRKYIKNYQAVPGHFEFLTGSESEMETVIGIVKAGGEYLTCGNFEFTFQV